jgi:hypothetical protein
MTRKDTLEGWHISRRLGFRFLDRRNAHTCCQSLVQEKIEQGMGDIYTYSVFEIKPEKWMKERSR